MALPKDYTPSKQTKQYLVIKDRDSELAFLAVTKLFVMNGGMGYRIKYFDRQFTFTNLTPSDVVHYSNNAEKSKRVTTSISSNSLTTAGTTYHRIYHNELILILRNFLGSSSARVNDSFHKARNSGIFSDGMLREIYPHYNEMHIRAERTAKAKFLEEQSKVDDEIEKRQRIERILNAIKVVVEGRDERQAYLGNIFVEEFVGTKLPTEYTMLLDLDIDCPTHIAVIGGSGSGKSISAFDIAEETLHNKIPVLVLDPTGQWSGFLQKCDDSKMISLYKNFVMPKFDFEFKGFIGRIFTPGSNVGLSLQSNLLAKPHTNQDRELSAHADDVMSIISKYCNITGNDAYSVRKMIFDEWDSGKDLDHNLLQNLFKKEKNIANKIHKLHSLDFLFSGTGSFSFSDIINKKGIHIVSLTDLKNEDVEMHVSYFVLRELVDHFDSQPDSDKLKLLLVIEEAHRFKDEASKMLERITRTLRKKGVGCVFVSQKMTDLSPGIRANIATRIWMRNKYLEDKERAKEEIGELSSKLSKLKTGTGILSSSRFSEPFFVKFRPCIVRTRGLSSDEITDEMKKKKCSSCGTENNSTAKFCINCGTKV